MRKSARVFMPSAAFRYTLPPRPPSPPSGPPKGTNFSRRKLTQPRPPLPACTLSLASSTNFMMRSPKIKGARLPCPLRFDGALQARPNALLPNDVDVGALLSALDAKFHRALSFGEQGVIGTDADVHAGTILRAALTDQNVAREHILTAEFLDAQSLRMRIATVASTATSFFVCHISSLRLLSDDRSDLHIGIGLPMVLLALVMLAAAKLHDSHLVALAMTFDRRSHLRGADVGGTDGHGRARTDQQNLIEFDIGTLVRIELLDTHHGTFLDAVLFTARGYHGIHCCNSEDGRWGRKEPRIVSVAGPRVKPAGQIPASVPASAIPAYGGAS